MAKQGEKIRRLSDFFKDSFNVSQGGMFLTVNGYEEVADAVNPSVGSIEYFFSVTRELESRGLVDEAFFESLRRARPAKDALVRALQELWLEEKSSGTPARGRPPVTKIKILFLASDPFKTHALALDLEVKTITAQIRSAEYRDSLDLISAWAVSPGELQELLLQHKPHVVHFSGHGASGNPISGSPSSPLPAGRDLIPDDGVHAAHLVLMGDRGQPQPASQEALVGLFKVLKDNIRLVVLNACHTKPQAEAIAQVIDCCIGMNAAIGDEAAIAFSAAFYRALGFGRDVQTAFELGRNELQLRGIREGEIPELHYRRDAINPAVVVLVDPR